MSTLDFDWGAYSPYVTFKWQDGKEYSVRRIDSASIVDFNAATADLPEDASADESLTALVSYLVADSGCPCAVDEMPAVFRNKLVAAMGGSSLGES